MFFQQAGKWIGPVLLIGAGMATGVQAQAQPNGCNEPLASSLMTIALPSSPFAVKPSADGCWVFVSLSGADGGGIAVLKRQGGRLEMVRVVRISPAPAGIALTHDGKLLVAAAINSAVVLDVARMTAGAEDPILGTFSNQEGTCLQCIYINVTPDDKLLFVSDEGADVIIVIDLERARANGFKAAAITGSIPVGGSPIALTFSPDGKWLYSTSESGSPAWNWPRACKPGGAPLTPEQVTARKVDMEARIAALEALQSGASEKGVARLQQQIDSLKSIIGSLSGVPLANPEGAVVVMM